MINKKLIKIGLILGMAGLVLAGCNDDKNNQNENQLVVENNNSEEKPGDTSGNEGQTGNEEATTNGEDDQNNTEDSNSNEFVKLDFEYSNLVDKESQELVKSTLVKSGISEETVNTFLSDVDAFNGVIKNVSLVEGGFKETTEIPVYKSDKIFEYLDENNPLFPGYNCRITSFDLMKDTIVATNTEISNPKDLFMDNDVLNNAPRQVFSEEQKGVFDCLFSTVYTEFTSDKNVHLEKWLNNWKEEGVEFKECQASMVSVVLHSSFSESENELFVGHVGVLAPMEDGRWLFVEKLAFQAPYQANIFKSKEDLNNYLMAMYDNSWDEQAASPLILENDKLLIE